MEAKVAGVREIYDYSIMTKFSPQHFHKGHYLAGPLFVEDNLKTIENPRFDNIQEDDDTAEEYAYDNASVFLSGSCNLFSLALNREFGYDAYEIKGSNGGCIHCFCMSTFDGQDVFIDVRGITTDYQEFIRGLIFTVKQWSISRQDLEADGKLSKPSDVFGFSFANDIIKSFRNYYTCS